MLNFRYGFLLILSILLFGCLPLKKEINSPLTLGCKQDEGFMILYREGDYYFPAQMPPGCRCFISYKDIEYVTTAVTPNRNCKENSSE
jgi:hypothetical protein|tara:strand:- start:25815 stop:26078 length:264 start_codon:yes stop_codon:yes gene_type:complete